MAGDDDEVRLTLRLSSKLRDALARSANKSGRSMHAEIVYRLDRSVDFEDTYGTLEEVMKQVWKDIEDLQDTVHRLDEPNRKRFSERD